MVKKGTKKLRKLAQIDRFPLIEKALRKRTKAELIETILMIAKDHAVVARELESRLDEMQIADRVGFICDDELAELRDGS